MSTTSLPWSKFYWADWESDEALRQCSLAAQGLWMRCLCIMHKANPRGYLTIAGKPLGPEGVARAAGVNQHEAAALLAELEQWGVFSRDRRGVIYSRRMLSEERRRKDGENTAENGTLPNSRRSRQAIKKQQQNQPPPRVVDEPPPEPPSEPPPHPEARGQSPEARAAAAKEDAAAADAAAARKEVDQRMAIGRRICDALGIDLDDPRWLGNFAVVSAWTNGGLDPELDIMPAVKAVIAKRRQADPDWLPGQLDYFTKPILEYRQRRLQPLPDVGRAGGQPEGSRGERDIDGEWRAIVRHWRGTGEWLGEGVPPGEIGCHAPLHVVREVMGNDARGEDRRPAIVRETAG